MMALITSDCNAMRIHEHQMARITSECACPSQSIDTKMQRCHHSYEKFREDHSMAKAQYWVRCEPPVLFVSVLPYLLVQQLRMHLLPVFEVSAPLPAWQAPKGYMSTTRTENCILRVNIRPPPPCRCVAGENGMQ